MFDKLTDEQKAEYLSICTRISSPEPPAQVNWREVAEQQNAALNRLMDDLPNWYQTRRNGDYYAARDALAVYRAAVAAEAK